MALIGETDIRGQAREVVLTVRYSLERGSRAKSHAMARNRVAGRHPEDTAEVMGRDRKRACDPWQWAAGLGRQQLASAVDEDAASAGRRGSSGGNAGWIDLFESHADERDGSFDELVWIGACAACGEHQPVREVEPRRDREGT
jgi:hypothetical protein